MGDFIFGAALIVYIWVGEALHDRAHDAHRRPWLQRSPFLIFRPKEFSLEAEPYRRAAVRWHAVGAPALLALYLLVRYAGW